MAAPLSVAVRAEFIGAFALSFFGMLAIHHLGTVPGGLLGIALAHGLVLGTMITALGAYSGGHFNPAVSFGFLLTGRLSVPQFVAYVFSQVAGAVVAGLLVWQLLGAGAIFEGTPHYITATPTPTTVQAILIEAIGTFFLVIAVWGSAVDPKAPKLGGMIIGLTLVANILAFGPFTGCAVNPSRMFGPTVAALITGDAAAHGMELLKQSYVYWVGPMLGGGLAAVFYTVMLMGSKVD